MTAVAGDEPLVSVAIPLYRSRRFFDTITANIDALERADIEILVSDRHLLDDTIDRLEQRYASDARIRFMRARDAIGWVDHYNVLLRAARGRYVCWMPHDDVYPRGYVDRLAAALEAAPDAVLAFGRVEQESLDGFLPTLPFTPPPVDPARAWSFASPLRMLTIWQLWFAFRGLVRRDVIASHELYLRPTRGGVRADIYWVFALGLVGPLVYVPACTCTKRFHRDSGGAGWRFDRRQSLDAWRVLRSYVRDFAPSRSAAVISQAVLLPWCLVQAALPRGGARRLMAAYWRRQL